MRAWIIKMEYVNRNKTNRFGFLLIRAMSFFTPSPEAEESVHNTEETREWTSWTEHERSLRNVECAACIRMKLNIFFMISMPFADDVNRWLFFYGFCGSLKRASTFSICTFSFLENILFSVHFYCYIVGVVLYFTSFSTVFSILRENSCAVEWG